MREQEMDRNSLIPVGCSTSRCVIAITWMGSSSFCYMTDLHEEHLTVVGVKG